jgi:hypothetical protein
MQGGATAVLLLKNPLRNFLAAARAQIHARPSRGAQFHVERRIKHMLQ